MQSCRYTALLCSTSSRRMMQHSVGLITCRRVCVFCSGVPKCSRCWRPRVRELHCNPTRAGRTCREQGKEQVGRERLFHLSHVATGTSCKSCWKNDTPPQAALWLTCRWCLHSGSCSSPVVQLQMFYMSLYVFRMTCRMSL